MTEPRLNREDVELAHKEWIENYPNIDEMVATGALASVGGGWFEPQTTDAFNALSKYASALRTTKTGRPQIKVIKPRSRPA